MDTLTKEVERALSAGLYYLAVVFTLTLPDICAALESADGETNRTRYMAWCDAWLLASYPQISSADLYNMRCGIIHQGRLGHPHLQYARILFTIPNRQQNVFHRNIVNDALNLDVTLFCGDVSRAVEQWYVERQSDPNVVANLPSLIRYRAQGLAPYMVGIPLIA